MKRSISLMVIVGIICLLNIHSLEATTVWEPQVGNFKIVEVNGVASISQTEEIDLSKIGDRKTVSVAIKNEGDVAASGTCTIETKTENASWVFEPGAFGTGIMQPEETKTFAFDVVDLTTTEDTPAKFKLTVTNSLSTVTDYRDFKVTLLPKGITETPSPTNPQESADNGIHWVIPLAILTIAAVIIVIAVALWKKR